MEIESENLTIWPGHGFWIKVVVITFEVKEPNIRSLNLHHGITISLFLWIKSWSQRLLPAVVLVLNTSASPTCSHSGATLLANPLKMEGCWQVLQKMENNCLADLDAFATAFPKARISPQQRKSGINEALSQIYRYSICTYKLFF